MSRPGMMKWKTTPSLTLKSVTPIAHSDAPGQFVLIIHRYILFCFIFGDLILFVIEDFIISFSLFVWLSSYSWYGPQAVGLAVPSTCVTTWMCGDRFGPKPSILSATIHQSKHICCDVLSQLHDWYVGCKSTRILNVLSCHFSKWSHTHIQISFKECVAQ